MTLSPPLPEEFANCLRALYRQRPAREWTLFAVLAHARAQGWTLRAMGEAVGVSRERIRQLAPNPLHMRPEVLPFHVPAAPAVPPKPERTRPKVAACGTTSGYKRHRRRREPICAPCRQANTDRSRARRYSCNPADAPVHGKASTYANWRCRCVPCRAAHSEEMAKRYREKGPR